MRKKIVLGSRGSLLALAQSEKIKEQLQKLNPELNIEIKVIMTSGDKDLVSNWENSNNSLKSFFTKEIERDLLDGKIDLAVHSMKDMPIISPDGLICGAIPKREDNRDVFVSKKY
ncbi:MAG: hydroxymethylbilane synthase, partial [Fusobacteriaceae bacterium]